MKIKVPRRCKHVDSGIYEVIIAEVIVRNVGNDRQQLQLMLEIETAGPYQGNHFFHCLMLDGSADFYLARLLEAVYSGKALEVDEVDSQDLIGKCVIVELENKPRFEEGEPLPNYYPSVKKIWSCRSHGKA